MQAEALFQGLVFSSGVQTVRTIRKVAHSLSADSLHCITRRNKNGKAQTASNTASNAPSPSYLRPDNKQFPRGRAPPSSPAESQNSWLVSDSVSREVAKEMLNASEVDVTHTCAGTSHVSLWWKVVRQNERSTSPGALKHDKVDQHSAPVKYQ